MHSNDPRPALAKANHAQLYDLLISELTDFVVVLIDLEGRFASWNPGVEANLGYSKEEFLGQPFEVIFTPEDMDLGVPHKEISRAAESGRSADTRWHVRKDRSRVFVDGVLVALRDESGNLLGFSKVLRDITPRKLRQDRLDELTQALNQAQVLLRGLDGKISFWSAGAARLYGFSSEEALGRKSHDLLRTEFTEPLEQIEAALIEKGAWHGELRHTRKDGSTVIVASDWVLHDHTQGRSGLVIETNTDVTVVREIQEKLLKTNDDLQHFVYAASHDLKEPIRNLRSLSELLLSRFAAAVEGEPARLLHIMEDSAIRMGNLCQDLLTYSRTGEAMLRQVNANEALGAALLNLQTSIAETGAHVTQDDLPTVLADPAHLMQLFQNLISNAIKYRSARKPEIHVGVRPEQDNWIFCVRDNGTGFDPAYAQRIFRPFERLHGRSIEGTGMGLAICKRIVERRNGRIWADTEPGRGSSFYFTWPRRIDSAST